VRKGESGGEKGRKRTVPTHNLVDRILSELGEAFAGEDNRVVGKSRVGPAQREAASTNEGKKVSLDRVKGREMTNRQ
jgi:hypothetical protein